MGYAASFTNAEPVAQSDVTAVKEAAVAASEKVNDSEYEGGPITELINKKVDSANKFFDKVNEKFDHLVDVGPTGSLVELADDKWGIKDSKVVNLVKDISDWAQS
jgi:hypothetical protein